MKSKTGREAIRGRFARQSLLAAFAAWEAVSWS
jgi:hypothetical protein